jgi:DNA-directed RNA polymerase specialized sigma24 family protein
MSFQYPGGTEPLGPASSEQSTAEPQTSTSRAFIELHGRSLHGFALLLCLRDEELAGRLAADALAQGSSRVDSLGHPERAAAWLRGEVYRSWVPTHRSANAPPSAALVAMGVDERSMAALDALDAKERAALVAADIERLDRRDAATVIGAGERQVGRVIDRARRRYLDAFAQAADPDHVPEGPLVRHIQREATRLLA